MEEYQFGEAARHIYNFLWGEYCDWYIEISKLPLYRGGEETKRKVQGVLVQVLEQTLRLLHPFMPFITEELWQRLPHQGESLIIAPWPEPGQRDLEAEEEMELIMEMVRAIRNVRSEYKVAPSRYIEAIIVTDDWQDLILSQAEIINTLARIAPEGLVIASSLEEVPAKALALAIRDVEIYLPLKGMVDLEREERRLTRELEEVEEEIARTQKLLSNQGFLSKAPPAVVEREREKLAHHLERRRGLEGQLERLS